jgi:hypothetical protein
MEKQQEKKKSKRAKEVPVEKLVAVARSENYES